MPLALTNQEREVGYHANTIYHPVQRIYLSFKAGLLTGDKAGIYSRTEFEYSANRTDNACAAIKPDELAKREDGVNAGTMGPYEVLKPKIAHLPCGPLQVCVVGLKEMKTA